VFLVSNYWATIRPSSTENENESSRYPESLASGSSVVPSQSSYDPIRELENPFQNLESLNFEQKSEIRKLQIDKIELEKKLVFAHSRIDQLEFESKRFDEKRQSHKNMKSQELNHEFVINELKRKIEIANNDKMELENELMSFKSRTDLLEFEKKQLEDEKRKFHLNMTSREQNHQSVIHELKRENKTAKNGRTDLEKELSSCKSRIDQLEFENERFEDEKTNHQSVIKDFKKENETAKNQSIQLEKELSSRIYQLEDENKKSLHELPEVHSDNKQVGTAKGILISYCQYSLRIL